jgi:uncharacterized protein YebE (UPF0316 family)
MTTFIHLGILFFAKMLDNALGTAKTILVQRNRCILAGIALALSNYIYFCITRNIVTTDSDLAIIVVSVASGVGCCLAMALNNKLSKERTFVNVIMSDDLEAMQQFRDFLAKHHITNVAADSYTLDWSVKTITITAYAETKEESMLINRYIENSPLKFKHVVQKG